MDWALSTCTLDLCIQILNARHFQFKLITYLYVKLPGLNYFTEWVMHAFVVCLNLNLGSLKPSKYGYIFSCDEAALQMIFSVCLSVRPSVCHTFFTMFPSSYHHEIFRSYYHGQKWCPCKRSRSKVKVTEVNTRLSRFRTLTPVWIHIWQWNYAHSWKQHRRGALLFLQGHPSNFKVTRL